VRQGARCKRIPNLSIAFHGGVADGRDIPSD
jgi:hypothetical protein